MKYGYARVSTVKQANEGTSLEAQRALLEQAGAERVIVDDGVSGSTPWIERPQGGNLIKAAKKGDCIVVTKLDRVFRSVEDLLFNVRKLEERGIDLVILNLFGNEPVGKNAIGKAVLTILGAVAELERETIAERTMEGKRTRMAEGFYVGGRPPFGHQIAANGMLVEEPWREAAVALMHTMREEGKSLRAVQKALFARFAISVAYNTIKRLTERKTNDIGDLV